MAECRGLRCAGCDTFPDSGAVAQLGERLVRNEEVSGSIPLSSTNYQKNFRHSVSGYACCRRSRVWGAIRHTLGLHDENPFKIFSLCLHTGA